MAEREYAGIGTSVLFENERVRIWEMDLAPGEATGLHHHQNDYVIVVVEGDKIAAVPPADSDEETFVSEMETLPLVAQVPRGGSEDAQNVGTKQYYEIIVELLDPPESSAT